MYKKLINYDFESAKEEKASWSGENIVKVPYKIDGTGFDGVVVVKSYNTDTWKEELEKVRIRQEKLRNPCRCGYSGDEGVRRDRK